MRRRTFLKSTAAFSAVSTSAWASLHASAELSRGAYRPGRIPNEYSLFLPGEREALQRPPRVTAVRSGSVEVATQAVKTLSLRVGEASDGWRLIALLPMHNGQYSAVFEKHVSHQGALAYVNESGEIAHIPKRIGQLSNIRPRPTNTPHGVRFERPARYIPGPDVAGNYILNSDEDPCYENIAALGAELIGWTLVANEQAGPSRSLWLEADGKSRQFGSDPQSLWAPDLAGRLFDPRPLLPSEYLYEYVPV